jgi:hypothetical protein
VDCASDDVFLDGSATFIKPFPQGQRQREVAPMKKRGVELSMNVIIIAAIALIILVLLVLLVTGAFKDLWTGTGCEQLNKGTCETLGGKTCADVAGEGYQTSGQKNCKTDETCCYQPIVGA